MLAASGYEFAKYWNYVRETLETIREEYPLEEFFGKSYILQHAGMLLDTLRYLYHREKIATHLDRETLEEMCLVETCVLERLLTDWLKISLIRKRDKTRYIFVELCLREIEDPEDLGMNLHWSVKQKADMSAPPIATKLLMQRCDMSRLTDNVREHKKCRLKLVEDMDDFLKKVPLRDHYDEKLLCKKKAEILSWIDEQFTRRDISFRFDYSNTLLYEHLFLSEKPSASAILTSLQPDEWTEEEDSDGTYFIMKMTRLVGCQQVALRAQSLVDALGKSKLLRNREKYNHMVLQADVETAHLFTLNGEERCISMTLLEEVSYNKIIREPEEKSRISQDEEKLTQYSKSLADLRCRQLCEEITMNALQDAVVLLDVPGLELEDSLQSIISRRLYNLCSILYGIEPARKVIRGCISRLITKANTTIRDRDPSQNMVGSITLKKRVILGEEVDEVTLPVSMRDLETDSLLQDHREMALNITVLSCMTGDVCIAQCVLPCMAKSDSYYVDATLPSLSKRAIEPVTVEKKARKRRISVANTQRKKVMLMTQREFRDSQSNNNNNDSTEGCRRIVIESTRVDNPDLDEIRKCPSCEKSWRVQSFCTSRTHDSVTRHHIKNICNSCRVRYGKQNK